jgi:hypothetical protein
MKYNKPEIAALGDAAHVIQGSKAVPPDHITSEPGPPDFELED